MYIIPIHKTSAMDISKRFVVECLEQFSIAFIAKTAGLIAFADALPRCTTCEAGMTGQMPEALACALARLAAVRKPRREVYRAPQPHRRQRPSLPARSVDRSVADLALEGVTCCPDSPLLARGTPWWVD